MVITTGWVFLIEVFSELRRHAPDSEECIGKLHLFDLRGLLAISVVLGQQGIVLGLGGRGVLLSQVKIHVNKRYADLAGNVVTISR